MICFDLVIRGGCFRVELSGCAFETEFRRAYNWRDEKASVVFDIVVIGQAGKRDYEQRRRELLDNMWP